MVTVLEPRAGIEPASLVAVAISIVEILKASISND